MDYIQISELYHHGIKGQRWGIRRYQNEDGSLTAEGRKRYNTGGYNENDPNNKGKTQKDWEKQNVYTRGNKYFYKDSNGNEHVYKTNVNELDDKQVKDLKSRIELENSINKFEADVQTREKDATIKKATAPARNAQNILNDSAKVLDATARALPTGNGKVVKKDYSSISDQELRNRISRLQLEESYGRLTGETKYIKSGSEKTREILQTAGAVVAIGASAAALTATILQIKAGKMSQSALEEDVDDFIAHHGVKGQKWGIRRYQNEDGSLTAEGSLRYGGKTHTSQLTEEERFDLRRQDEIARSNRNKKIAIGVGIASAAVIAAGAAFVARKYSKKSTELSNMKAVQQSKKDAMAAARAARQPGPRKPKVVDVNLVTVGKDAITAITSAKHSAIGGKHMDYLDIHELYHHGIKGQKWGERRFQNEDGSLTAAGKERYRTDLGTKEVIKNTSSYDKLTRKQQRQYMDYGKKSGAMKGALIGMGVGALAGGGKAALSNFANRKRREKAFAKGGKGIANSFVRNMIIGAFGGAVVGTFVGSKVGEKSSKVHLAEHGKEYVDNILDTPVERLNKGK